jgi:class 3 adenylate cyclase/pimeloyl-ACP methyl ester carboxylesterase
MVPETRWATTVDGASIAYQDLGEGPVALVVIHGWISHLEVYWEQPRFARFMRRLSRNMRVLHFDKRGTGMSDRIAHAPDLESRLDDVRAVVDAAGVERVALLGWGSGGPPLALFFAATHPERTIAVCTDGEILFKRTSDYPWGLDEEEEDQATAAMMATWGQAEKQRGFVELGFGSSATSGPELALDPNFLSWCAKFARYSATPTSYAAFDWMWFETDIRAVLGAVQASVAVFYKTQATDSDWGSQQHAAYLAERIPTSRLIGIEGAAPVVWIEEPEPLVSAIEAFLATAQREEANLDRVLATVLFTDIVASTDTAVRMGDRAWKQVVERHHATVRTLLGRYRGTELDTAGDGFYASFDGPARAVRCAQAIVKAVHRMGLEVRAGLHTGEVEIVDGKPGGIAVSIGARIASQACASEVLVSQTVKDVVVGSGLSFEPRGTQSLKGVPGEWRLFAATDDAEG